MQERRVVKTDSPDRPELEAAGWVVIARSWGARLETDNRSIERLAILIDRVNAIATIRELGPTDAGAVLALDRETADDYPGDVATSHSALTPAQASPTIDHRGWGAFARDRRLVAMTFVESGSHGAETHFTVVHRGWRGRGLGTAVKAASVIALVDAGHRIFRTGGSMDNPASIAANRAVGYELDEEWLTFAAGPQTAR
ncbi:GNAT family N-acetyltransferase [Subtercola vilae]|uniref:Acetyltransferase n=1 Tax=Subtercola vilae TaxID=2056433 RepID=A0A4T2BTX2_9MICO|nr:acetyltransferase [Subtercola vilae]TIH33871.1 acetyltransferase [Subtercola vilae]